MIAKLDPLQRSKLESWESWGQACNSAIHIGRNLYRNLREAFSIQVYASFLELQNCIYEAGVGVKQEMSAVVLGRRARLVAGGNVGALSFG